MSHLKQKLKEEILKEQGYSFTTPKRYYYKSSDKILKDIFLSNETYKTKLTKLNIIKKVLKKVLFQDKINFISYISIKEKKIVIYATNHIGRSELNYQKNNILYILKNTKKFKDLQNISVMIDKDYINNNQKIYNIKQTFSEKSNGIFTNSITNKRLYKKFENIREAILKNG